jgi:hypothetical protein
MGEYVNSKQVRFDRSTCSCGVLNAHHLPQQSPNKTLFAILTALYHKSNPRPSAFVMFSDVIEEEKSRGQSLAIEIKKTFGIKFVDGTYSYPALIESPIEVNPRTGNRIKVWLWTLEHDALRKYYQEELANRIEADE